MVGMLVRSPPSIWTSCWNRSDANGPSGDSSEGEIRDAQRQIYSDLAFDRQRLQRYGAAGSADQHLGAQTQTYGNVAAGADVTSSQRASADLAVSGKNSPEQRSPSCHAYIDAQAPDRASIDVLLSRCARNENTPHILPRSKDQSDPRTGAACQPADPKRRPRLRTWRSEKDS